MRVFRLPVTMISFGMLCILMAMAFVIVKDGNADHVVQIIKTLADAATSPMRTLLLLKHDG